MSMPWVHQTCNYAIEEFSCINHWAFSWNCFVLFCFIAIVKYNTTNRLKVAIQITSSKWNLHWYKHWVLLYTCHMYMLHDARRIVCPFFAPVLLITYFLFQDLDDAVLRRFSKRIYVRLPGKDDRVQMLLKLLSKQYNDLSIHEVHQVGRFS